MNYLHKGLMLFFGVTLIGGLQVHAQDQKALSLQDIYSHIQETYPSYLAKKQDVVRAQSALKFTQKGALPSLQVQTQLNNGSFNTVNGGFLPLPGALNVSGNSQNITGDDQVFGSFSTALLQVDIYSFGQRNKRNKQGHFEVEVQEFDQQLYLLELKAYVSQLYIELLFVQQSFTIYQQLIAQSQQIYDLTHSLVQAGLRPEAQDLLALASTQKLRAKLSQLQGLREKLVHRFGEFVPGFTLEQALYSGKLFNAIAPIELDEFDFENHPLLGKLEASVNKLEMQKRAQKTTWLPSLKFLAGYSFRTSGISENFVANNSFSSAFDNTASNYIVGLGIVWNVSNVFSSSSKVKEIEALAKSQALNYHGENQRLVAQSTSVQQALPLYFQSALQSKEAVEKAEQSYTMYLARFETGLIDLAELLSIQEIILQTQQSHLDNVKQYWNTRIDLALVEADFSVLGESL